MVIAGPQNVADGRHILVQDRKIDCEGAAGSPSVILGTPSENGDLRHGRIGSRCSTEDERIEVIVPVPLVQWHLQPFPDPAPLYYWTARDTGRYPIAEDVRQIVSVPLSRNDPGDRGW